MFFLDCLTTLFKVKYAKQNSWIEAFCLSNMKLNKLGKVFKTWNFPWSLDPPSPIR